MAAPPQSPEMLLQGRWLQRQVGIGHDHINDGGLATLTAVADLPPFRLSFMSAWCTV